MVVTMFFDAVEIVQGRRGRGRLSRWFSIVTTLLCVIRKERDGRRGVFCANPARVKRGIVSGSWDHGWSGVRRIGAEKPMNVVVALGDSTTDGYGSTVDANRRYPDVLARRLAAEHPRLLSILNAGICWNELLGIRFPQVGEATVRRVAWDVLEQTAVTDVIVQIGINDLRHDAQTPALIEGLQRLATLAREHHLRVFGTTILPGAYTSGQAIQWRLVNSWLRKQGTQYFDAVFDFATPLGHPEDETRLAPRFNSGDNIHPNDAGYQVMAETVDLAQLMSGPA
ncbi:MAG: hypothetical protein JOZ18_11155 [Chloroflexi bacterium]|nr:hypothetical protein [Chloroflexota bacterium]